MKKQFSSRAKPASGLTAVVAGCAMILATSAQAGRPQPATVASAQAANATRSAPVGIAGNLSLDAGKGTMISLNEDANSVFVADPAVADVHVPSPRAVFVLGKKPGTTTLYVTGANNKPLMQRTIVVERDLESVRNMLSVRFPTLNLQLTTGIGSLMVAGALPDSLSADAVVQALTPFLTDKEVLVNRMTIAQPLQIQLRVRITEVDRNVTQQLGINWQSLGNTAGNFFTGVFSGRPIYNLAQPLVNSAGGTTYPVNLPSGNAYSLLTAFKTGNQDIQAMIDALNQEGLITTLAEPNLVALSGQTASFLAGGEFPVPVSQVNGAISVDFKQFGVKLDFTPTVLNDRRISLKVRPEVSQIDNTIAVTTGGITIPGLSVRRADTTVELASGQSFAIAGLLQSNSNDLVSQVPGIGSIPILGKLFSSTNYQNNKTELVIMVTPYLVAPTSADKLHDPIQSLDGIMMPSSDVEYSLGHRRGSAESQAAQPRLIGAAGYVY